MATIAAPAQPLYLAGEWIETGDFLEVHSPYSGELVGRVARAGADEARRAIDAAERAMREPLPPWRRADILERISQLLREYAEDLAQTICAEAGKPLKAARVEAARAVNTYALSAGEARRLTGESVPIAGTQSGDGHAAWTVRVPIGIVGAISPFNFPLNLVAHKLAPALAAGCAVVHKPASQTPLSALRLAALSEQAGLPPGWLSVLPGRASDIGDVLVEDPRVPMLTFTGSAEVGWGIRARAARKKVALELGNASPVIVEPDADLDLASSKVATHAYSYAGQTCVSVQRVYVQRDIEESFVARLVPKVEALRVGDPADEATDVGPVIDTENRDRIRAWIEEAVASGAEVLTGGVDDGGLLRPTVLRGVTPEMKVCSREIFGPVCSVIPYDSLGDAFHEANSTEYGLQAAIFTRSLDPAVRAASGLDFGSVMINEAPEWRVDQMPYGGTKASGNTKEGPAYTIREMTEERLIVLGGV
ncbi:MAG TPA: aldehyde dehydrogenase family protein [Solirubrobacteraceae bacterium]|nr:aldehyde dehydrogenase family protein [Solirubrobacteraceae bacterium]